MQRIRKSGYSGLSHRRSGPWHFGLAVEVGFTSGVEVFILREGDALPGRRSEFWRATP